METYILSREIFGCFLGSGYGSDCSKATINTRASLLSIPTDNMFGRSFFRIQKSKSNIRYTAILSKYDKKHDFFAANGRKGAYLGISLSVTNNILDLHARQIMWNLLDELRGNLYTETPEKNLVLLTDNIYGSALRKYDFAINSVVNKYNNSSVKPVQNNKENIFDSIYQITDYEYLNNLNFFRVKNQNDTQNVKDLLNSGGISLYKVLFNNTFVIADDVYSKYMDKLRADDKATNLVFYTKNR